MSTEPNETEQQLRQTRLQRNQLLANLLEPNQRAWLVEERYRENGPIWLVAIVRQGLQGAWMRQRYDYDIPSGTLYFAGERPISEDELAAAQRDGQIIH